MIAFIIWLIGVILGIKAILEIFRMNLSSPVKLLLSILLVLTSWVGIIVYYLIAKDNLEEWFKK